MSLCSSLISVSFFPPGFLGLVLRPPPWAAGVLLEWGLGFWELGFCMSAVILPSLAQGGLNLDLTVGQWSGAGKTFPSPTREVCCLAGCAAEWCCGWMKALALCCGGKAASTNPLCFCSSSLGALGTQECPSCPERRCHGAVAAWCPPFPLLQLQLFNCGVTFGKGLGLWASS